MFAIFEWIAQRLASITTAIDKMWQWFSKGPLQTFLFYLILVITGIVVILRALFEEFDRLLANIEKALISIALLMMVVFCFLDYVRREFASPLHYLESNFNFPSLEINGGITMSVVLMVWVGFLGASLATRQKKHLSVDATDRILSPKVAKLVKRFTALLAAVFCWKFTGYSTELISHSLIKNEGQEALPFWRFLHAPVDWLGGFLHPADQSSLWTTIICSLGLGIIVYLLRLRQSKGMYTTLNIAGSLLLFIVGLGVLSIFWSPTNLDQTPYQWQALAQRQSAEPAVDMDTIADLVGGDTGEEEESNAATKNQELQEFTSQSSGGEKFPKWLAQSVIPLSFLLMALRFLGLAFSGRFEPEDEDLDGEKVHQPPPPTFWEKTTGRGKKDLLFGGLFPGILLGVCAALGMKTSYLIFFAAIMLILVGSPLFLVIGVVTVACFTLLKDFNPDMIAKDMYEAVKKEELLAIPFFVLAGNLMTQGSIATRLVNVARALMGSFPGGLGLAAIFACVIFAAISGSSPVTVIAVGSIMYPMLIKDRYPNSYSTGVLTSAGSLGIIIPPSVPMIIYALMVGQTLTAVGKNMVDPQTQKLPGGWDPSVLQVNPADLFVAGILPGLFIAAILALYTVYHLRPTRKELDIVVPEPEQGYLPNLLQQLRKGFLSIMLPVLILGGIYGILGPLRFSVTEAAAVAVVYALVVELLFHRELAIKDLPKVLSDSGVMMGSLFLIIVLAIAFNKFLTGEEIPQSAALWIQDLVSNKWQFLLLVNLFLLALGCVMDIISAILIVAPLLAPIAMYYGIHPLHFGIMFIVNLELGYLTPPLGINLFVSSTVLKRPVVEVMKSTAPFLLLMLFCLGVIVFFPFLSLALL